LLIQVLGANRQSYWTSQEANSSGPRSPMASRNEFG
jgi:hypothetical protein